MKVFQPASLDDSTLEKVHQLEKEIDKVVVAYDSPAAIADLSAEDVAIIAEAEKRLGKVLVAYEQ